MFAGPAAPLDGLARGLTAFTWLLGVGFVLAGAAASARSASSGLGPVAVGALVVVLCLVYRRLQPTGYRVDDGGLEIERRSAANVRFAGRPLLVPDGALGFRRFGSGGLYGYLGSFRLRGGAHGPAKAFVTDRSRAVVLELDGTRVVVSPQDEAALLAQLERVGG